LRPAIVVPVVLAILLVAAVAFAVGQFAGDKEAGTPQATSKPAATTTTAAPVPPPPPPAPTTTTEDTVTETETDTPTSSAAPESAPTANIGADCAEPGATGVTADGATAYCANLQYTGRYLWSMTPGEIANPVVTASPTAPLPIENESPVRICMQQTGHSRLRCAEEVLHGTAP
jgi:serine/threonine-protein kinase